MIVILVINHQSPHPQIPQSRDFSIQSPTLCFETGQKSDSGCGSCNEVKIELEVRNVWRDGSRGAVRTVPESRGGQRKREITVPLTHLSVVM